MILQFTFKNAIIRINMASDFETDVKNALLALNSGGIILYPTDTIWGLGCDPYDVKALNKIYDIKRRPRNKSFIILLAEPRDVLQHVAAPHPDIIDIVQDFDRPTTIVYDDALGFPDELLHHDGSLGIRVTTDPFCKALIKRWGKPLVSTSANISGEPSPAHFGEVSADVINNVDYVVTHRQDDTTPVQPSRIIKIKDDGTADVIRG